jgi:hypothetical protein
MHTLAAVHWALERETLEAWAAVARAFVLRKPAAEADVRSEELSNQGGGWILQFERFTDPEDRPIPFAAILDGLPAVVIVPSLMPDDAACKELREHVWGYANAAGLRVEMNNEVLVDLGAWLRASSPGAWYDGLRQRWAPAQARLLIITACVPDPRGPVHQFYAGPLTSGDQLFRTTVEAAYSEEPGRAGTPKDKWLHRMRDDGICALEIVREPTLLRDELVAALEVGVMRFMDEVRRLEPRGVVICGERPFSALVGELEVDPLLASELDAHARSPIVDLCPLIVNELPLLHSEAIASPTTARGRKRLAEIISRSVANG